MKMKIVGSDISIFVHIPGNDLGLPFPFIPREGLFLPLVCSSSHLFSCDNHPLLTREWIWRGIFLGFNNIFRFTGWCSLAQQWFIFLFDAHTVAILVCVQSWTITLLRCATGFTSLSSENCFCCVYQLLALLFQTFFHHHWSDFVLLVGVFLFCFFGQLMYQLSIVLGWKLIIIRDICPNGPFGHNYFIRIVELFKIWMFQNI